jgi:hypothetical protein
MANDPAPNQVHLFHNAVTAAPVLNNLTVTLHGAEAPAQRFQLLFPIYVQGAGNLFPVQWLSLLFEDLQDELATRNGVFVLLRFPVLEGIDRRKVFGHALIFPFQMVLIQILSAVGARIQDSRRRR